MERHFGEVRIDFFDEVTHKWSIDAWKTFNDNEEGVVVGHIDDENLKIEFVDKTAENDAVVKSEITSFLYERVEDFIANYDFDRFEDEDEYEDEENNNWEINGWEITDDGIEVELTRMNDKTWSLISKYEIDADFDTLARYLK